MHLVNDWSPPKSAFPAVLTLAITAAAAALYLSNASPARFGHYHDDSIYVVTAKSLATGDGYRIISLPQSPSQTKYPPFYPYFLSLIWRMWPQFPKNLPQMLYLSAGLILLFHLLIWGFLRSRRHASPWQCALIIALLSFNFRELLLATSLLSEPLSAVLSIASLWLTESYVQSRRRNVGLLLSLSLMLSLLTRLAGVALLMAVILYLKREKLLKANWLLLGPPVAALGLWLAWCHAATTWEDGRQISYYTSYFQDWMDVVSDYAYRTGQSIIMSSTLLMLRNLLMLATSVSVVILGFSYRGLPTLWGFPIGLLSIVVCFSLLATGFLKQRHSHPSIIHIYTIMYLLLHILWPYTAYDRFLMPILPFLLLYLVRSVDRVVQTVEDVTKVTVGWHRIAKAAVAACGLIIAVFFVAHNYVVGTKQQLDETTKQETQSVICDKPLFAWLAANTNPSDVLMCYQDAKCFLFTGRKAVRNPYRIGVQNPERALDESILLSRASFIVLTASDFSLESKPEAARNGLRTYVRSHPDKFASVFETDDCGTAVFRIARQD